VILFDTCKYWLIWKYYIYYLDQQNVCDINKITQFENSFKEVQISEEDTEFINEMKFKYWKKYVYISLHCFVFGFFFFVKYENVLIYSTLCKGILYYIIFPSCDHNDQWCHLRCLYGMYTKFAFLTYRK